ncbi:ADP-ribosylation factor-like protein 6-interacting protein 6 isoform X1 [Xyrichtys novacula]|uniref:ADP-ribosylation factor-like protein 6-interacting protein 6 isoform X1 n=1 Tax=Xyrichtys novacula TaxID=13765 RepID=A0AAV1HQY6_XYRNO|nr:ADP-ribosylation factor-like protein 6-interacting protein 6 isoform X1 [Xyrichtys novacula]
MPRSATDRESFGRFFAPEDSQPTDPVRPRRTVMSSERHGESLTPGRLVSARNGPKQWSFTVLSVLGSAVAVAAVGCFCALIYPILRELRAERVKGEDGTEQRMLGFWSILVLSLLAGCICCVFSWTLTYMDSQQPNRESPTHLQTPADFRETPAHGFHMSYGVAVLNGIMAMLTVIWSLT